MHSFDTFIPQFATLIGGTRFVVTLELVSEILHVLWVSHLDLPPLSTFEDELLSLFCETPSSWGERQNTSCSGSIKGPKFLSIVMTFVLYPLCHYNSITELHARFLLSLLKDLFIDFPSHFILSLIDVYRDTTTRDKLIFCSSITKIIRHSSNSYHESPHFTVMCAISAVTI